MTKTWSTRDCDYAPGNTVKRTWSKSQVVKTLLEYRSAVSKCVLDSHSASPKEGPQGVKREQELSGSKVKASEIADKVDDWTGDVKAYVSEVENGKQKISVQLYAGYNCRYRYKFEVDADVVMWEI